MTPEDKAKRDELRAATLGAPAVRKSILVEWNGKTFEVKRPSIAKQLQIDKLSKLKDGEKDVGKQLFLALINCIFVPGTDVAVFESADEQGILGRDMDDFVGFFMGRLTELQKSDSLEAAEKN